MPVNYPLTEDGLMRYSKGQMFHFRRIDKLLAKNASAKKQKTAKPKKVIEHKVKKIGGADNGKERIIRRPRAKSYYPTETIRTNRKIAARRRRRIRQAGRFRALPKLKPSLKPGTICIVLAGCQVGKRVVFLKQMEKSGLALVTGPYKLNGCPLRRVNQIHLMATGTRIDLVDLKMPETVVDDMFVRHDKKQKETERKNRRKFMKVKNQENVAESLFGEEEEKGCKFRLPDEVRQKRKVVQNEVDVQIMAAIDKQFGRVMKQYLVSRFRIDNGVYPHRLRF